MFPLELTSRSRAYTGILAAVDNAAPDPELNPPPKDGLEPAAYARAQCVYKLQIKELQMRKSVRTFLHFYHIFHLLIYM